MWDKALCSLVFTSVEFFKNQGLWKSPNVRWNFQVPDKIDQRELRKKMCGNEKGEEILDKSINPQNHKSKVYCRKMESGISEYEVFDNCVFTKTPKVGKNYG